MASSINYRAGNNIQPSRFCSYKPLTAGAGDFLVIEADGTQPIVGISQEGTAGSPGVVGTTLFAAASGSFLNLYADEDHDECLLYLGASVTGGQLLKADSNALGIPAVLTGSTTQYVGAEARETGASGALIRVRPRFQVLH